MSTLPQYVYVASSWRNPIHPDVVETLRSEGIPCYDFKREVRVVASDRARVLDGTEVVPNGHGLRAGHVGVGHDLVPAELGALVAAMERADTFVLVLPCGRSAHLELGWAVGDRS